MIFKTIIFSKMTFACLSEATATSKRVFHQTQNTFNRIHNTFITDEIHDQGKQNYISQIRLAGLKLKLNLGACLDRGVPH